ncbi:MAG: outer membrane beta-barrel protein [Gammaproteobacteria bacterium]|nr:outer membrane beta-barrel protein [Gammaproteobacteria bacterium]
MRIKSINIGLLLSFFAASTHAGNSATPTDKFRYPFYVGVSAGYGATTWNHLVSTNQTAAMTLSTPIKTHENGAAWGFFGGYELMPTFAIEAAYTRYPSAKVYFDDMSLFTFDYNATEFNSRTEALSASAKFMIFIPTTTIRAFSTVGIAGVHRSDYVYKEWLYRPTFGIGFNYNFTPHVMVEVGGNYTAGSGQAELDPALHYVPFTYSGFARLAYRF